MPRRRFRGNGFTPVALLILGHGFRSEQRTQHSLDDEEEAALTLGKDTLPEGFENWKTALDNLYEAFLRYTGLTLQLGYISESDSDADEVGVMWFVSGVETFTPAGEKFKDLFKFYQWVEYG